MIYKSLTDVPHDLKQGIDWLIAVRGDDAEYNLAALGAAVHKFLADKPVGKMEVPALEWTKRFSKLFLRNSGISKNGFVKILLKRYEEPMTKEPPKRCASFKHVSESDYKNVIKAFGLTPKTITKKLSRFVDGAEKFLDHVKIPEQYESSYSSEATWDASCAKDPEACAVVLVGIAPMLYAGLRSLNDALWKWPTFTGSHVEEVMKGVGYQESEFRGGISGTQYRKLLGGIDPHTLDAIYDLAGFWAFY